MRRTLFFSCLVLIGFLAAGAAWPRGEAGGGAAAWEWMSRDEVLALLGEPSKSKRAKDGTETLTYRLVRLDEGVVLGPGQRLITVPGVGPCATLPPPIDAGVTETLTFEPTSIDEGGGLRTTQSRSVQLNRGERAENEKPTGAPAGRGRLKLRLRLDASGRVSDWSTSGG